MILGYEEAGSGPVLVLIHAFPTDHRIWDDQLRALSDIRRVVAVDLRGRGRSPATDDGWTIETYGEDVAETIDSLDAGPVDLGGISMGGYVVFDVFRRRPDLIRSLILASTRCTEDPPEGKAGRSRVAALVREKGTSALIGMMFDKMFSPHATDLVKAKVRMMFEELPAEAAAGDSLAMRDRPDSTQDLAKIATPTLVLHGEDDQLMPIGTARRMAAAISGAEFVPIPAAGHLTSVENPEAVNAALRSFLAGVANG